MRKPLRSVDNRDLHEVERSDNARIEALQRKIADLQVENQRLKVVNKGRVELFEVYREQDRVFSGR